MATFTQATPDDYDALIALMRDFYADGQLQFTYAVAEAARALLQSPQHGVAYLIQEDAVVAGYFVITLGYSMERGGKIATLDELFILPHARRKGIAKQALAFAVQMARSLHCRTLLLEVDRTNPIAQALYQHAGFVKLPRDYLGLDLT